MSSQPESPSTPPSWQPALLTRRAFQARMQPPPLAFSADGRSFGFRVVVDNPVVPGSLVTLTPANGRVIIGQVLDKRVVDDNGPRAHLDPAFFVPGGHGDHPELAAALRDVSVEIRMRIANGDGVVLGEVIDGTVHAGSVQPFEDAVIAPAGAALTTALYDALDAGRPLVTVGATALAGEPVAARLRTSGFGRHTFLCGQSGSGKTFSLGLILERLLVRTTLRIVVLDPNGDFVRMTEVRSSDDVDRTRGVPADPGEYDDFVAAHRVACDAVRIYSPSTDRPARVRFRDLSAAGRAAVLRLDPLRDREEYDVMQQALTGGGAGSLPALLEELHRGDDSGKRLLGLRIRNLGVDEWAVWARGGPSVIDAIDADERLTVVDLGGLDTDDERHAASLAVLERLWETRTRRIPTLIVIDEAHNVVPAETHDPVQQLASDLVVRIAGEGRKFGLFLLLASQRPDKVHANALSQCDNLVLMRMNSDADLDGIARTFSFAPEALVRQSRWFGQGESVVAGPIVSGPLRLRFGGRYTAEGGSDVPSTWAEGR